MNEQMPIPQPMSHEEIDQRLRGLNAQGYPLCVSAEDAKAIDDCISRIMDLVPEDDKPLCSGDYARVTAAIHHPVGEDGKGEWNEEVGDGSP